MQPPRTFSPVHLVLRLAVAAALVAFVACSSGRAVHKVYPVKGKILVNGKPANECKIYLNRTFDDKNPVMPTGLTNESGEFQITSYDTNDGAPEGKYVVTIEWRERSGLTKMDYDGPDRLGGAYAKVESTKGLPGFTVQVERQPQELPPFELKQSADAQRRLEEAKKRRFDGRGPLMGGDQ
jgi:hypothetical protein